MILYKGFNNILDELPYDQAIFSDKIYRKIRNLDNSYYVCELNLKIIILYGKKQIILNFQMHMNVFHLIIWFI